MNLFIFLQWTYNLIGLQFQMFRKQQTRNQLLVIGDYRTSKSQDFQRIRQINIENIQGNKNYKNKKAIPSNLVRIYSQESSIAVIDSIFHGNKENEEAWLITQPFNNPVNISELIRKKIVRLYLGEKEMIVQTKDQYILINWGSIKTLDKNLLKISTFNTSEYNSLFMAYFITSAEEDTFFYYSLDKKNLNSNRLFQIRNKTKQIIGYPTLNQIKTDRVIKGISVGKYHSLFWDAQGNLYSWGCQSLALGYGYLPEDITQVPQRVNITKYILTAFAATHYSLALTSEGTIYQWGVKTEFNEINEEPIFNPRRLYFRFFQCNAHFVSLKGRDNNFAALSTTGQLYVWGLNAKNLISPSIQLPSSWQGSYIYEPVLQTDLLNCLIIDYSIQLSYISVLLGSEASKDEQQEEYWQVLKEKVKTQLASFKSNRMKTQSSENLSILRKKYKNPLLCENNTQRRHIFDRTNVKFIKNVSQQRDDHQILVNKKISTFKRTAPLSSTCWPTMNGNHKRQVSDCFDYSSPVQSQKGNIRSSQIGNIRSQMVNIRSSQIGNMRHSSIGQSLTFGLGLTKRNERSEYKFSENYSIKLQGVLKKKKKIQNISLTTNLKKIDERQIQFKQKRKFEEQVKRKRQEQEQIVKITLYPFLTKYFLSKLILQTLEEAHNVKIDSFKQALMMNNADKNMQNLFIHTKVKLTLQLLQKDQFSRFVILALYFKKYVKKFRQRRRQNMKNLAIQSIIKRIARKQISEGIVKIYSHIRNVNKMGQWIYRYNKKRMKILKQLWNNFILATFKTNDGGLINAYNVSIDATFSEKFVKALEARDIGSLDHYYKGLIKLTNKRTTNKKTLSEIKRRGNFKFIQDFKEKLSSLEILPYSLHYNCFKRPKNLQIAIKQGIKTSGKWIQIEKKALFELLREILRQHDLQFVEKKRQYQFDLANYIKLNYDIFYQMRWKYIIQYNKMQKTLEKSKKQKELRRILGIIGMQKLIDEDYIPQKYIVLQQALRGRDVPQIPNPVLDFDLQRFQHALKLYWQNIYVKAKQIKNINI